MATGLALSPIQVVELFVRRWSIEQLFPAAKNHLGLDSAEVRKECSVIRHAALGMALVTWIEVWAHRCCPTLRERPFAGKLATLRADTITQTIYSPGPRGKRELSISTGVLHAAATATA